MQLMEDHRRAMGLVLVLGFVIFCIADVCKAGTTSSFIRNDDLSLDMPLDSDVFQVPPGYNAPQQVSRVRCISFSCVKKMIRFKFVC